MAKREDHSSSRLMRKVATAIETNGTIAVEMHLDRIIKKDNIVVPISNARGSSYPIARAVVFTTSKIMGITRQRLMNGTGEKGRLGLNFCYHFIKANTNWTYQEIASFFGRSSHSTVLYGLKQVRELDAKNNLDKEKLELQQEIANELKLRLSKNKKAKRHGTEQKSRQHRNKRRAEKPKQ